jgi:hypothetical protein
MLLTQTLVVNKNYHFEALLKSNFGLICRLLAFTHIIFDAKGFILYPKV